MAESSRRQAVTKAPVVEAEKPETLEQKVERVEAALSRIAVMCGQGNVLPEYGIQRWVPGKEHMNKYKS